MKRLSYIEDARCLKVNAMPLEATIAFFFVPAVGNGNIASVNIKCHLLS